MDSAPAKEQEDHTELGLYFLPEQEGIWNGAGFMGPCKDESY
jgi:hypothetical protein